MLYEYTCHCVYYDSAVTQDQGHSGDWEGGIKKYFSWRLLSCNVMTSGRCMTAFVYRLVQGKQGHKKMWETD